MKRWSRDFLRVLVCMSIAPVAHAGGAGVAKNGSEPQIFWRWIHKPQACDDYWRWSHKKPQDCDDYCPALSQPNKDSRFTLTSAGCSGRVTVERQDGTGKSLWRVELDRSDGRNRTRTGAIETSQDRVYISLFDPGELGCIVLALDAGTGELRWQTPLMEPKPELFSLFFNQVQLDIVGGKVVVFRDEGKFRSIAVLEPENGTILSSVPTDGALASIPWSWNLPERPPAKGPRRFEGLQGSSYELVQQDRNRPAALKKLDSKGVQLWEFKPESDRTGEGTLLQIDDTVFLACHSAIASGVWIFALDAGTGGLRWKAHPLGAGPILHSKYHNAVGLRWLSDHLVVFGKESAGNYIEVLDPTTGRTLANQFWPNE